MDRFRTLVDDDFEEDPFICIRCGEEYFSELSHLRCPDAPVEWPPRWLGDDEIEWLEICEEDLR